MARKQNRSGRKWYAMDLHLHTPASSDYQQKDVSYLDILKKAESRGLNMIAFTDHNTVAGYRKMQEEIETLKLLESLKRILPEEQVRLKEYQRLLEKIVVLPGFEFTATFGFHILGLFSPEKPVREIEHILLDLNVPSEHLDEGSATVGASSDVLTAYEYINDAGGIAIAAHANSTNGVAMRGFAFGGQTKIAYTQDSNLYALEVTDLEQRGGRTTAGFFNGTKPEYPRRMHCIQGSDAHRLEMDASRKKNFGVGDRATEALLPDVSFEDLKELFLSNDFARTRPRHKVKGQAEFDFISAAREEGANIIQDFHESMSVRGGKLYGVIADVCAFANTNGGTLYIGVGDNPKDSVAGVSNANQAIKQLEKEITNRISPVLECTIDTHSTGGKNIIRILVPRGEDPPYALDDNKIYIREEAETNLAVRDEIVGLVARGGSTPGSTPVSVIPPSAEAPVSLIEVKKGGSASTGSGDAKPPRTGVEIVSVTERNGSQYFAVKDLRNGNTVNNVTKQSARRLWHYAITRYSELPKDISKANIEWKGDLGLMRTYQQAGGKRFDLVQRIDGDLHTYYGVTEAGIDGEWRDLVKLED